MHVWRGCILTGKPAFLASFTALEFRCFVYGCMKKFSDPAATYSSTVHWIARVCIIWYLHTSVIFGYFRLHPHRVDTLSRCSSLLYLRLFRYHFHAFHWIYHPVPLYPPPPPFYTWRDVLACARFVFVTLIFFFFFNFPLFFCFSRSRCYSRVVFAGAGEVGEMVYKICVLSAEREESISRFSSSPLPVSFRILKCVPFSRRPGVGRTNFERQSIGDYFMKLKRGGRREGTFKKREKNQILGS